MYILHILLGITSNSFHRKIHAFMKHFNLLLKKLLKHFMKTCTIYICKQVFIEKIFVQQALLEILIISLSIYIERKQLIHELIKL